MAAIPSFGTVPLEEAARMSGLELLAGIRDGTLPQPPIGETVDFRLTEVEKGRAVFEGEPTSAVINPLGSVHGGWISTLLDSCMGCAIHSTLDAGMAYTTIELKVNFVRAVMPGSGTVRAEGKTIEVTRRFGTSEGRLLDGRGRLLAFGTTTCFVFPVEEIMGRGP